MGTNLTTLAASPAELMATTPQQHNTALAVDSQAALMRAQVEARAIQAMRFPRDMDQVTARILKDCKRPSFAHAAMYKLPRGSKTITGLTIRFAEAALGHLGNVEAKEVEIFDGPMLLIVKVIVSDLERNTHFDRDLKIEKTVERSKNPGQGNYLSKRVNSYKKPVYTVMANEGDLYVKRGMLVSKAVRDLTLRLLPGEVKDLALGQILETLARAERGEAQDPNAAKLKITGAFMTRGIDPAMLKDFLGHSLDSCTDVEMEELRNVYKLLKEGETTWDAVMDEKTAARGSDPGKTSLADKVKAKARKSQPQQERSERMRAAPDAQPKDEEPPPDSEVHDDEPPMGALEGEVVDPSTGEVFGEPQKVSK